MEKVPMGENITPRTLIVASKEQVSTSLDDEEVILHTESGTYFGLNHVGKVLWDELDEPRSVDELQRLIAEEFDVSEVQAQKDVMSFLDSLLEADLIEIVDRPDL